MVGANSIRDVIAFPKSADFKDLMAKAPACVDQTELDYYNIAVQTEEGAAKVDDTAIVKNISSSPPIDDTLGVNL